jgi:hypothetical protein
MTRVAGPRPAWCGKVARLLSACLSKRHCAKAGGDVSPLVGLGLVA